MKEQLSGESQETLDSIGLSTSSEGKDAQQEEKGIWQVTGTLVSSTSTSIFNWFLNPNRNQEAFTSVKYHMKSQA